jgi:hypothetical protein
MRSSVKIASIFGIDVRIHLTFLLFLVWIWFSYYQVAGFAGAVQGVLFMLALLLAVWHGSIAFRTSLGRNL